MALNGRLKKTFGPDQREHKVGVNIKLFGRSAYAVQKILGIQKLKSRAAYLNAVKVGRARNHS